MSAYKYGRELAIVSASTLVFIIGNQKVARNEEHSKKHDNVNIDSMMIARYQGSDFHESAVRAGVAPG
jgi:hypothetical protein